jgi:serine/threonine protein kinase
VNLERGSRLGHYEIVEPLPGTAAESYKASDTRSSRTVTLKAYPPHLWDISGVKQQLERDIQAVAVLKHPHIGAPTEIVHEAGADYLVTEYVEGETLAERLKRGPLEVEEALTVAVAIADALDKAHRQGVVHRGLNPSTIVLTAAGAKVIDFGFAQVNEPSSASLPVSAVSARTTRAIAPSVSAPAFAACTKRRNRSPERTPMLARTSSRSVPCVRNADRPAGLEGKTSPILAAAIQTVDPGRCPSCGRKHHQRWTTR